MAAMCFAMLIAPMVAFAQHPFNYLNQGQREGETGDREHKQLVQAARRRFESIAASISKGEITRARDDASLGAVEQTYLADSLKRTATYAKELANSCNQQRGGFLKQEGVHNRTANNLQGKLNEGREKVRGLGVELTAADSAIAALLPSRDASYANYKRLRDKVRNAADSPLEFWNSWDVVINNDISDRDDYGRKYNGFLVQIQTLSNERAGKYTYYNEWLVYNRSLESKMAQARSNENRSHQQATSSGHRAANFESASKDFGEFAETARDGVAGELTLLVELLSFNVGEEEIVAALVSAVKSFVALRDKRDAAIYKVYADQCNTVFVN
jgi:hypothetical protein